MYTSAVMEIDSLRVICESAALACAAGVGVCTIGAGAYWIAKKLARSARQIAAVSLVGAVLIGGMVVVGTDDAGTKPGTNDVTQVEGDTNTTTQVEGGTNNVGQTDGDLTGTNDTGSVGGPLMLGLFGYPNLGQMFESITDEDIAQGWRLVSASSNALPASTFVKPDGAAVWENARDFGAGWGSWKIPLDGWRFSFGDEGMTNAFVWVEGYFRSRFNSRTNEITLLNERMALCPAANWSRYNLPASRAWSMTNGVGGIVTTFENAAVGDDPSKVASAQMELSPQDGTVSLRYDLRSIGESLYEAGITANGTNHFVTVGSNTSEVVFQRVHPDDWDFDGLPNALDPSPRQADAGAGFNQSDTWAMLAFPSNAAEIASMGYAAWAAARAADPNRRLVALTFVSMKNAWPACLTFGDVQVMCDGAEEIIFPVDCGARYAFSIPGCELSRVRLVGTDSYALFHPDWWYGPYDFSAGDVQVRLDAPGSGWLGSLAEVSVDGLDCAHFFPNDSRTVTAVVTNCHADAYIGCTWSGGEGITFSNSHSLETVISWQTTNSVAWATNRVTVVTTYEGGYAITNGYVVSVGPQAEPTTTFTLDCPAVQFLNDGIGGDRSERVYRVSARLLAAPGTRGTVTLACSGGTATTFYHSESRRCPVAIPETFPLEVPSSGGFESGMDFYITSAQLGRGTVDAVLVLDDEGGRHEVSVSFQVIEPIRKLVNTNVYDSAYIVNPVCLVRDTDAVLKVSVNLAEGDEFSTTNNVFHRVSGPGEIISEWRVGNDWYAIVAPTSNYGSVTIEARFNGDAIQPRFVLPIVGLKTIPVKVFIVDPPIGEEGDAWKEEDILAGFEDANFIFAQIGVRVDLVEVRRHVRDSSYWRVQRKEEYSLSTGEVYVDLSEQLCRLVDTYGSNDCVEVYFVGELTQPPTAGLWTPQGIVIPKDATYQTLAHELGHALGLFDCYVSFNRQIVEHGNEPISKDRLNHFSIDWGDETGRGFYGKEDTLAKLIQSYLMFGVTRSASIDIPYGAVFAWPATGRQRFVSVGKKYIRPLEEVYSK